MRELLQEIVTISSREPLPKLLILSCSMAQNLK